MPKPWKQRLGSEAGMGGEPPTEETPVDWRETAYLAAELGSVPELDLHARSVSDAIRDLEQFLHQELNAGSEAVRIIYGVGEGRLRSATLKWLEAQQASHNLIALYRPSAKTASVVVVLERLV